jgi:Secretion system C-terminal sorting domain/Heparinase II/III-like protein
MKNNTDQPMKKISVFMFVLFSALFGIAAVQAQTNIITLNSLPGGSKGPTVFSDTSTFTVSAAGAVSVANSSAANDWGITAGTVTQSGALNKTFGVVLNGMSGVNRIDGKDYGKKTTDGGIDRAADGSIGIIGGADNGINANEGLNFGLSMTNFTTAAAVQITKIYIRFAGNSGESGILVGRVNPNKRIVFGNSMSPGVTQSVTDEETAIDISSFNILVNGGSTNTDLFSVFNNSAVANSFRVTRIELKVLTNSFNLATITTKSHPRLLLRAGEEASIQALINTSPEHLKSHNYIIATANSFLQAAPIVKPTGTRILAESQDAIEQIFFLSYAYRMTNEIKYLNKTETVMNDVCNWDNWITYSLDTCEMTFAVAIGYDWLFDGLSAATKQKAREKILNYGFLTQKNKAFWNSTSNWNQVCIGSLASAALAIYGDGTTQMNNEAAFVLNNVLVKNPLALNTYGSGSYAEGPMYWSYGTSYQVLLLAALESVYGKNHEGINRLIQTPGFLESAKFMQYVTGPTALYFNYSDSTAKQSPLPVAFWMAEKANNPSLLTEEKKLMENGSYSRDFGNRRFLPFSLIYGKNLDLNNVVEPQAKLWNGYGTQPVLMVRTAWQGTMGKYFGLKGGTPTYSHAHMDGGFFVYDSQGLRWAMDFGKYDYDAQGDVDGNDFSQTSDRWDIFRVSNLNQNTISIKKASETAWQKHKVNGAATIDEIYDTDAKRGGMVNMKSLLGLNNELLAATRSAYLVDGEYFEVKDYLSNGAEPINVYWNMVTKALVQTISPSKLRLTQGGKTVVLEVVSSNPLVSFNLVTNRSTDPVFYNPTATADSKNPGTVMIGFEANVPANNAVTFTVTIKDDVALPPSSVEPINNIILDLPNPTTGLEGNSLFFDTSELHIDTNGLASIGGEAINYAWRVNGGTNVNNANNAKFFFRWSGMGTTDTTAGPNYGALLSQTGMDRATSGELGVRGGAGAGIDPNEGFNLGFNLSYLPNTVQLQLVKVGVTEITGAEMGIIVNRKDTSKRITFGGSSSTAVVKFASGRGDVNVENLGIILSGGETNYDLASLFNPATSGSFRMNKFVFKVIDNSSLSTETFEIGGDNQLVIYPNPFKDSFTIINSTESKSINLKIYTIQGAEVLSKNFVATANQEISVDVKSLSQGIYIVQLDNGQEITTKKMIKNN